LLYLLSQIMDEINDFINRLASQKIPDNSVNLYRKNGREGRIRRNNLFHYLKRMQNLNPSILLLGEAPGYNGARLSGVAFTSESIINQHSFFAGNDFQFINNLQTLQSELSATIVWTELSRHNIVPLIWNIFPFHPHLPSQPLTNRTPSSYELKIGREFTIQLLRLFNIRRIIAVGRKSESQIKNLDTPSEYIRHPAQGGSVQFISGLRNALS
jgi:uracil-DNA glycosylase